MWYEDVDRERVRRLLCLVSEKTLGTVASYSFRRVHITGGGRSMVYRVPGKRKKEKKTLGGPMKKEIVWFEDDQGNKVPMECDVGTGVWWENDEYVFISKVNPVREKRRRTVMDLRPARPKKEERRPIALRKKPKGRKGSWETGLMRWSVRYVGVRFSMTKALMQTTSRRPSC